MDNSSHNSFEDQWRDAFDDASMTPSDWVWDGIEASLEQSAPSSSAPEASGGMAKGSLGLYSAGLAVVVLVGAWLLKPEDDSTKDLPEQPSVHQQAVVKPVRTPEKKQDENYVVVEKNMEPATPSIRQEEAPTASQPILVEELVKKSVVDSINFISPTTTKEIPVAHDGLQVNHRVMEPTVPSIQTPYFEPQPPVPVKTQKKGFLKNVKITVGAGVYQRP
ncbi:hypothetical protein [Cellulophaga sp. BC115SP]|uniref:hypothetical protein n=1 Tax=Cellulophaga sp. BC115SP TaxID=2683263 RepID=UPI0014129402|nr:hypothetical protein [Cellulophaga sp. BC115SP]NBB30162.1 hypothetical protein [Cellulophaga sp. BC115SP]